MCLREGRLWSFPSTQLELWGGSGMQSYALLGASTSREGLSLARGDAVQKDAVSSSTSTAFILPNQMPPIMT